MIEKPLCLSSEEGLKLKKYDVPIFVNNLHLYSPAFEKLLELVKNEQIIEINSIAGNKGPYRNYSALFDYGSHDVPMGMYLLNNLDPILEFAKLHQVTNPYYEIVLSYNLVKHRIIISNNFENKKRWLQVITENNTYIYDDLKDEKLTCNNVPVKLNNISALDSSFLRFIRSFCPVIQAQSTPSLGLPLYSSLRTVKILEQAENICNNKVI